MSPISPDSTWNVGTIASKIRGKGPMNTVEDLAAWVEKADSNWQRWADGLNRTPTTEETEDTPPQEGKNLIPT